MAKKELEMDLEDLKKNILSGNVTIGSDTVLKSLKQGKLSTVFLASNCASKIREEIEHLAQISNTPLVILTLNNEELGVLCKKNFFVATIGINGAS